MSDIKFSPEEKQHLVDKLQTYFEDELQQELGQFDADFLLDFISEHMGNYYYNRGVQDAQLVLQEKVEAITDALYEIEKPTRFHR
ncbi:DUF2164 domain-containing protein [Catenovulum maritimum]|uniref:DUF2164 domain-containing protein n=1 Tax=Catenovulum maritimum TaxID=1513271 RepID=A0A0J8GN61_9ALTE|nr:DUF2164 domain-containing protein [Catenovulum maritimum]KMT64235.1 hypothetical protein XM47_15255 [Catenovulum maritimum]